MGAGTCVLTGLTTAEANEARQKQQTHDGGGGARYEGHAHDGTAIPPVDTTNGRTEEAEAEDDFLPYCHNEAVAPKASNTAETCAIDTCDTYNCARRGRLVQIIRHKLAVWAEFDNSRALMRRREVIYRYGVETYWDFQLKKGRARGGPPLGIS